MPALFDTRNAWTTAVLGTAVAELAMRTAQDFPDEPDGPAARATLEHRIREDLERRAGLRAAAERLPHANEETLLGWLALLQARLVAAERLASAGTPRPAMVAAGTWAIAIRQASDLAQEHIRHLRALVADALATRRGFETMAARDVAHRATLDAITHGTGAFSGPTRHRALDEVQEAAGTEELVLRIKRERMEDRLQATGSGPRWPAYDGEDVFAWVRASQQHEHAEERYTAAGRMLRQLQPPRRGGAARVGA